jgi:tetratricopeptide (TPR) repeat protein
MARYDRIARIAPPPRKDTFNGWFTLRDLEGREREPELGRRARLRYLAIRPLQRLLERGLDGGPGPSITQQVEVVREELSQLPARDPERERLARYLREIGGRSAHGLVRATFDVGHAAEAGGHLYAAEEFYRTGLEIARRRDIGEQVVAGLRFLGRVLRDREEWEAATAALEESADLANRRGDGLAWARSTDGLVTLLARQGRSAEARRTLESIEKRAAREGSNVLAVAKASRCAMELAERDPEAALAAGWDAISLLPPDDEGRNGVLLNMAAAFRKLGLHDAAATCYEIVARWAAWPEHRAEARMERAVVAAEAGDTEEFLARRKALLDSLDRSDRHFTALLDLGLGRGALLAGRHDLARDHLRDAISAARDMDADEVLERSESLLDALEADESPAGVPREWATPSAPSLAIADRLGRFAEDLVHR